MAASKSTKWLKRLLTHKKKGPTMSTTNTAYIDAYTLGYLKAALKEHLKPSIVEELFTEAEQAALDAAIARAGN